MSAMAIDDEDDAFQADLARAIAASLEPDGSGPPPLEDVVRGDGAGWNALLAAGQAATTWGGTTCVAAGRCSPSVLSMEDDDEDFQRQIAAAMAASIQSVEEDRRRREQQHAPGEAVGAFGALPAPGQGLGLISQDRWAPSQAAQQPQGVRAGGGSVCCSSGLLLKPLGTAGRGPGLVPFAVQAVQASPFSAAASRPWLPLHVSDGVPTPDGVAPGAEVAEVTAAVLPSPGVPDAGSKGLSPVNLTGPTPACSPRSPRSYSFTADEQAGAEASHGAAGAHYGAPPVAVPVGGLSAVPVGVGPQALLLGSSPAKHARTPSVAGGTDSVQPMVKRSRPASESGAVLLSDPIAAGCGAAGRAATIGHAWPPARLPLQQGPVAGNISGASGLSTAVWGGGAEGAVPAQSYSPPERPASAASGCTASAGMGSVAGEDGEYGAATGSCPLGAHQAERPPPPQQLARPSPHEAQLAGLSCGVSRPPLGSSAPHPGGQRAAAGGGGGVADPGGGCLGRRSGSWPLPGSTGPDSELAPPLPPQGAEQHRQHRSRQGALSGVAAVEECGGGSGAALARHDTTGSFPGSGRFTLDLSTGGLSSDPHPHLNQQQRKQPPCHSDAARAPCSPPSGQSGRRSSSAGLDRWSGGRGCSLERQPDQQPAAVIAAVPARRCGSADGARRSSGVAPLDLSRPFQGQGAHGLLPLAADAGAGSVDGGGGGAHLRWPHSEPPVAREPFEAVAAEETAAEAGASDLSATGVAVGVPGYSGGSGGWAYSGADRRMLLHQRVWWWLGPGQVQSGRISSIDRRSEPLLYSVRLDSDVAGAEGAGAGVASQTIIATADCLFPFLSHGDKLMCRLPPSSCGDGYGAALQQGQGQGQRRLEEWPAFGGGEAAGAAVAATSCAWMCGELQHCIFDGRTPMVHMLLGPERLPYSAPYEFVVPVSDAAEGSGCAPPSLSTGAAQAGPHALGYVHHPTGTVVGNPNPGYCDHDLENYSNNTCTDMVPVGLAA